MSTVVTAAMLEVGYTALPQCNVGLNLCVLANSCSACSRYTPSANNLRRVGSSAYSVRIARFPHFAPIFVYLRAYLQHGGVAYSHFCYVTTPMTTLALRFHCRVQAWNISPNFLEGSCLAAGTRIRLRH